MAKVKIVKVPVPQRSPSLGGIKRSPTPHRARVKFDDKGEEFRFQLPSPWPGLLFEGDKSASKPAVLLGDDGLGQTAWSSGAEDAVLAKPVGGRRIRPRFGTGAKKGRGKQGKQDNATGNVRKVKPTPGKDASKGGGGKQGRRS